MQWMVPINELGPQQARILEEISSDHEKTHWISGYAGTGKTIVITHAIERIVARTKTASVCFLTYTHALKDLVSSGLSTKARDRVVVDTIDSFRARGNCYDYILVDEIQDVKEESIKRIFHRARYVVAAGDPEQSIYLGRVNAAELRNLLGGAKKHTLKHIQRLSLKVFQLAASILPDAKFVTGANVNGAGSNAKIIKATSKKEEFLKVYAEAVRVAANGQPSAILFPLHRQIHDFASIVAADKGWGVPPVRVKSGRITSYEKFNNFFIRKKSPIRFLGSNNGSLPESDRSKIIYLMTYHSAKGLDFNNVFLPELTSAVNLDAKWGHMSSEENERRHFFVAITRSKENLYFSYHGEPNYLLNDFPDQCVESFVPPRSTFRR